MAGSDRQYDQKRAPIEDVRSPLPAPCRRPCRCNKIKHENTVETPVADMLSMDKTNTFPARLCRRLCEKTLRRPQTAALWSRRSLARLQAQQSAH